MMSAVNCSESFRDSKSEDKLRRLLEVRRDVLSTLRDNDDALQRIRSAKDLDINQVLAFADHISLSMRAPRLWQPGHPLCGSLPPAPQLEDLRVGAMADYNKRLLEHAQAILSKSRDAGSGVARMEESGSEVMEATKYLRTPGLPVSDSMGVSVGAEVHAAPSLTTAPWPSRPPDAEAVTGARPPAEPSSSISAAPPQPRPPARRVDINMGLDSDSD